MFTKGLNPIQEKITTPANSTTHTKHPSKLVVGTNAEFKTIQSAINHARILGSGTVHIEPGNYTENLTLYSGITLEGGGIADLKFINIYGEHSLPESGELGFNHIFFANTGSIFKTNGSNKNISLLFRSCVFEVENGYVLKIPRLSGNVIFFDCLSTGNNNGFIDNRFGACSPTIFNMTIDGGKSKNEMLINTNALFFNLHLKVKIRFLGKKSLVTINGGCWVENTISVTNCSTIKISCSNLETQYQPALYVEKSSIVTLDNCSIESTATNVITGDGSIRIGNVSFPKNSKLSSSIDVQKANEFHKTTKLVGEKGNAAPLPQAPAGYTSIMLHGKEFVVPYYHKNQLDPWKEEDGQ